MNTETKNKGIRVRVEKGKTYLDVDHQNKIITFIPPYKGPNDYANVRSQILEENLLPPTMAQNVSLIYAAWQSPQEHYSKEIIRLLREKWLWGFTGIRYEKEGAYIQNDPEVKEGRVIIDKKDLVKRLESNDPSVRFVEFGYQIGEHKAEELAENKFVKSLVGDEGAEKLAEVVGNYKVNPYL